MTSSKVERFFDVEEVTGSSPVSSTIKNMKPCVYFLKSLKNGRYYIGSTIDINRRLVEHNNGKSRYTKYSIPFQLVFKQNYSTLEEARMIERKIKRLKRKDILERIINEGNINIVI